MAIALTTHLDSTTDCEAQHAGRSGPMSRMLRPLAIEGLAEDAWQGARKVNIDSPQCGTHKNGIKFTCMRFKKKMKIAYHDFDLIKPLTRINAKTFCDKSIF